MLRCKAQPVGLLLVACFIAFHAYAAAPADTSLDPEAPLTRVSDIKRLNATALGRRLPVDLTGVVTYYDPVASLCFIQDPTGGISVQVGDEDRALQAGQLCRLTGLTAFENEVPCIDSPFFTVYKPTELPAATLRNGLELRSSASDGEWVAIQGTLRSVFEQQGRLVYRLDVGGERVDVIVNSLLRGPNRAASGSTVFASGVSLRNPKQEKNHSLRLFAPSERSIRVEAPSPGSSLSIRSARSLSSLAENEPARVRLRVKEIHPGSSLVGEDLTGSIRVFFNQSLPIAPGAILDLTGFIETRAGERILEDCSFQRIGNIPLGKPLHDSTTNSTLPVISSAVAVRRLSGGEAARGYPVRLRGVITYYDPDWRMLFFQGSTEGLFVKTEQQDLDLHSGQLVLLSGVTGSGDFAPVVQDPIFEVLSTAPMPEPRNVTYAEMFSGVHDSQWVRTEGIITSVSRHGSVIQFELSPPTGNGSFAAYLPGPRDRSPTDLVGTRVEIEGACGTIFNSRRELRGIHLFIPELRFIRVLASAAVDLFASDPIPVANLFGFTPEHRTNKLVHVRGVLTRVAPGRLHLEDSTTGILILPADDSSSLTLHDTVDAIGFPRQVNGVTTLDKAQLKKSPVPIPLAARVVRTTDALADDSDLDSRLVETDGLLIENGRTSDAVTLLLESESHLFNAVAPLSMGAEIKSLAPGSRLHVKGVCSLQRDEHGDILGFRVLLRQPKDVSVLSAPPFWGVRQLLIAASLLAFGTTVIFVWVLTLRSRVRLQTTVIRKHLEAQIFLHERFVEFTKHFPGIAFMKTEEGDFAFANQAFLTLAQKTETDVLGKTDNDLWPAQVAQRQRQLDQELLSGKGRLDVNDAFDLDGKRTWLTTRFLINGGTNGKRFLCGIGVDITEQRNLEEKLLQAQKMECVGRLAGGVAHDFNNILQIITSYAEFIQTAPPGAPVTEFAQEIFTSASRAAELTRQLLLFSRKQVVKKGTIDLNDVSRGMAKMLTRIVGEDILLELRLSATPCLVNADRGMLEQVILNLAVNARDAMPKGGCLRIESQLAPGAKNGENPAAGFVSLKVADTGCGIKPENMPKIFEPFFTTKEIGRGTGLGLATVYAIVQEHSGSISVDSKVGVGTSFEICLPASQNAQIPSQPVASTVRQARGTETILLVEDDETVRKLSARILSQHGYNVIEADSGPAALDIARRDNIKLDLAITDMVMPGGLRGIELCEPLNKVFPALPIIITSGYAFEAVEKLSELNSNTTFLQKPFLPDDLLSSVRTALCARQ